jgi:hypothetical protein
LQNLNQIILSKDEEHLKYLVIFSRIYGVIDILFSLIGVAYLFFIGSLIESSGFQRDADRLNFQLPPEQFMKIILFFVSVMILFQVLLGIMTIISGQFIKQKRYRTFSIVIAGLNCISFPLGTALGVFTIIVLFRDSVVSLYDKSLNTAGNI